RGGTPGAAGRNARAEVAGDGLPAKQQWRWTRTIPGLVTGSAERMRDGPAVRVDGGRGGPCGAGTAEPLGGARRGGPGAGGAMVARRRGQHRDCGAARGASGAGAALARVVSAGRGHGAAIAAATGADAAQA